MFILHFIDTYINPTSFFISSAVGCPEVPSNDDMWFRREGNTLDVGCYATDQEWHLSCRDIHWVGALGNCTGMYNVSISY